MKKSILILAIFLFCLPSLFSHCQMPCGIYDDTARINAINEHIATIEKSMKKIMEISMSKAPDYNQIVRWVNNKEHFANEIQEIISDYFMTQRIKPVSKDNPNYSGYLAKLEVLHKMLIYTMKCKQTTNLENILLLKEIISKFSKLYFEK